MDKAPYSAVPGLGRSLGARIASNKIDSQGTERGRQMPLQVLAKGHCNWRFEQTCQTLNRQSLQPQLSSPYFRRLLPVADRFPGLLKAQRVSGGHCGS
jgi:hypothetical protein